MKDHDSIEKESRVGEIPGICFGDQDSERERERERERSFKGFGFDDAFG